MISGKDKIDKMGRERKLFCTTCTKLKNCEIIKEMLNIKRYGLQLTLLNLTKNKELKEKFELLERKRRKCLRKNRYLHLTNPKYIFFKDSKYENRDSVMFRYQYCGKLRKYLLNYPDEEPTVEEAFGYR